MECTKRSYETKEQADLKIAKIKEEKGENRKPIRSYKCDKCNNFHLTSWSKSKKKVVAKRQVINQINRIENEAEYWKKKKGW